MKDIYEKLSAIPFLSKHYTLKFFFIAFLGIHIPLIGLIVFVLYQPGKLEVSSTLLVTALLTVVATALTLYIVNGLLSPFRKCRQALNEYRTKRNLPTLPMRYQDEVGQLMQNLQFTLTEFNDLLEEKKDLAALLSHDLRIPVRNVKTFSSLLLSHQDPESIQEIANMLLQSCDEQSRLLESTLEILRQDHLFFNDNIAIKTDPVKMIDTVLEIFEPVIKDKSIRFKNEINYKGHIQVQPDLFVQVLKNLLSNAVKFSYPNSFIVIRLEQREGKIILTIKDDGIGFKPEITERLFDRFTKSGREGTAGEPSTGIGLYLSRKIIRHQQGELVAHSDGPGKGASFCITLIPA